MAWSRWGRADAIKKCGDTSIHPNDGDIKAQAGFDRRLIGILHAVFIGLLGEVYELPDQEAGELEMLRAALKSDSDHEAK